MSERERDEALVAVQTKNVLLSAANTELLRQLRIAERKASALDWLEAHPRWTLWVHRPTRRWQAQNRDTGACYTGLEPWEAIEAAMRAEQEGKP